MPKIVTDNLDALLGVLPPHVKDALEKQEGLSNLLEVVLDLGRLPEARFPQHEVILSDREVSYEDIGYIVSRVGSFTGDNRAGIERTLHRISAIRNRRGEIVGLTCRVGRAIFGTIKIIEDLVGSGKSILLLGRPGVGKTTMLRETARVLANDFKKRVIIVDTSNEIAGDGDIPHPAIGHARRMQVARPDLQHAVMIEAVENHMPEVIIIDEIGTELEAKAARTIAERGVQLVGTAHGNTLDNLMMNPTLSDLVGGIEAVTLGDEEARRRGTQKSILERRAPPTFDIVVEICGWDRVVVHPDVALAVDAMLRGQPPELETRYLAPGDEVKVEKKEPTKKTAREKPEESGPKLPRGVPRLYLYGVNKNRLQEVAQQMNISLETVSRPEEADMILTLKRFYWRHPKKIQLAEASNVPIYVLRSQTPEQLRQFIKTMTQTPATGESRLDKAIAEAKDAAEAVRNGQSEKELSPAGAYIRRLQHLIAERNNLFSESVGSDPDRRVVIYKEKP